MYITVSAIEPRALSSAGGTGRLWNRRCLASNLVRIWVHSKMFLYPRNVPFRLGLHRRVGKRRPSSRRGLLHMEELFRKLHRDVDESAPFEQSATPILVDEGLV